MDSGPQNIQDGKRDFSPTTTAENKLCGHCSMDPSEEFFQSTFVTNTPELPQLRRISLRESNRFTTTSFQLEVNLYVRNLIYLPSNPSDRGKFIVDIKCCGTSLEELILKTTVVPTPFSLLMAIVPPILLIRL